MHERNPEIEETEEERRQHQIELSLAQFDAWLADDEEPTEEDVELFKEFMRDIDAHRGERKLFTDYLK